MKYNIEINYHTLYAHHKYFYYVWWHEGLFNTNYGNLINNDEKMIKFSYFIKKRKDIPIEEYLRFFDDKVVGEP